MRIFITTILCFCLCLAFCQQNRKDSAAKDAQQPNDSIARLGSSDEENSSFIESLKKTEKDNLKECKETAARVNDSTLEIKLNNGTGKLFVDTLKNIYNENTIVYFFDKCIKNGEYYSIAKVGDEWSEYLILNSNNGNVKPILSPVVMNDSKSRFFCSSIDLAAAFQPTGLDVWKFNADDILKEYSFTDSTGRSGPDQAKWVNDTQITFNKVELNEPEDTIPYKIKSRCTLILSNGNWKLKPDKIK